MSNQPQIKNSIACATNRAKWFIFRVNVSVNTSIKYTLFTTTATAVNTQWVQGSSVTVTTLTQSSCSVASSAGALSSQPYFLCIFPIFTIHLMPGVCVELGRQPSHKHFAEKACFCVTKSLKTKMSSLQRCKTEEMIMQKLEASNVWLESFAKTVFVDRLIY